MSTASSNSIRVGISECEPLSLHSELTAFVEEKARVDKLLQMPTAIIGIPSLLIFAREIDSNSHIGLLRERDF